MTNPLTGIVKAIRLDAVPLGLFGWAAIVASMVLGRPLSAIAFRFGVPRTWVPAFWIGAAGVTASQLLCGSGTTMVWGLALGWLLLILAPVDAATLRLPDAFTIPLTVCGFLEAWPAQEPLSDRWGGFAAAVTLSSLLSFGYRRLRGRTGLGLGDVKLLGAAGAWLGLAGLTPVLLIGCALGFVWLALRALRQGAQALHAPLPFGAALCAGFWLVWLASSFSG